MSKIKDPRIVDFIFIWKIENFSFIRKNCASPIFLADTLKKTKWRLYLNYRNEKSHILKLVRCDRELYLNVFYELSILSNGGLKQKSQAIKNPYTLRDLNFHIPHDIIDKKEILTGDTLTIQCKMWEKNTQFLELGFGFARTRIGTERKSFIWTIDNFTNLKEHKEKTTSVELCSYRNLSLTLTLLLYKIKSICLDIEGFNEEREDIEIRPEISVLNISDGIMPDWHERSILLYGTEAFEKPVWELKNADLLLPDDTLSLKCDLVVSKGVVVLNELERTTYGVTAEIDLAAALANTTESPFLGNEAHSGQNSLKNDLSHLFEDKYHADISLRVLNKTFPVHKAILSARSPVFKAMLDIDMEEKLTNLIEIDDMEPDAMHQFLSYLYSDTLDSGMTWENASCLYLAAEKYAVFGLKEKCSCFLKMNLSKTNACEIFVLADTLRDEGLKNYVQSFIQDNGFVIYSKEWKDFVEKHPKLAVGILTHLYENKKIENSTYVTNLAKRKGSLEDGFFRDF